VSRYPAIGARRAGVVLLALAVLGLETVAGVGVWQRVGKPFAGFALYGTMTVDQLNLYDSQNVQYVEFMVSSWCPNDRERFVKAVSETTDDASKLAALEASVKAAKAARGDQDRPAKALRRRSRGA